MYRSGMTKSTRLCRLAGTFPASVLALLIERFRVLVEGRATAATSETFVVAWEVVCCEESRLLSASFLILVVVPTTSARVATVVAASVRHD